MEGRHICRRKKVEVQKALFVVASSPLIEEHLIRGNEGGRTRREEWRVNKTGDTGKDMMRCLQVCMEFPLSRDDCVSLVCLQTAIRSFLPVGSTSALPPQHL